MGNTQAGSRKGSKQVVTVLQRDGRVLEFQRSLRVADLLYDHPKHFVCHSSDLVLLQQGKMLPPNAVLMRGEVYFLLPLPKTNTANVAQNDSPVTEEGKPGRTMKFLITKQQLAKILAEGTIKLETKAPDRTYTMSASNASHRSGGVQVLHRPSATMPIKRAVTWSPGLESISEVPVM